MEALMNLLLWVWLFILWIIGVLIPPVESIMEYANAIRNCITFV
jgi:hypothetical protein